MVSPLSLPSLSSYEAYRADLEHPFFFQTDAIPASSIRRIAKELNQLRADPPEGIRVVVDEEDISQFTAWVQGPGECKPSSLGVVQIRELDGRREGA